MRSSIVPLGRANWCTKRTTIIISRWGCARQHFLAEADQANNNKRLPTIGCRLSGGLIELDEQARGARRRARLLIILVRRFRAGLNCKRHLSLEPIRVFAIFYSLHLSHSARPARATSRPIESLAAPRGARGQFRCCNVLARGRARARGRLAVMKTLAGWMLSRQPVRLHLLVSLVWQLIFAGRAHWNKGAERARTQARPRDCWLALVSGAGCLPTKLIESNEREREGERASASRRDIYAHTYTGRQSLSVRAGAAGRTQQIEKQSCHLLTFGR